jgi:hypothetical protein
MPNEDVTLNINLRWSRQGRFEPNAAGRAFNVAIDNVGFRAAKNRQRRLQANLQRDFAPVVEQELQNMARDVSRMAIGLANPNNPPPGVLSITGRITRAMIGNSGPMTVASMTGTWAVRTKAYMKRKVRKYGTRRWFKNTGRLQEQLGSVGTYRSAYGPMSVKFFPSALQMAGGVSSLGRSGGGQSRNISVGRLEVAPFRRLTLADLPGIGQQATYNPRLLSPLADSVERKLTGRASSKYRPVIEPFLTYYLTRRIPNAVYRRLEDSLS